jgi:O-methyltransferase domain/Dimerisation domain
VPAAMNHVVDLIFGRWRSQILYVGAKLDVFAHLSPDKHRIAAAVASEIGVDPTMLYRLLRALATIELVAENEVHEFRLTDAGALLRTDHPQSLRAMALLEEGPEHYAIWKHLVAMVGDGRQNGFDREYGMMAFDYANINSSYGEVFDQAMSSYSAMQTEVIVAALAEHDMSTIGTVCDVGGGHGHFGCGLLRAYPHLSAIIFDRPEVVAQTDRLWALRLGFEDRCRYLGGDMFSEVPVAEAYTLKLILHDWNDDECVRILANIRRSVSGRGQLFVAEHVVPGPAEPHFSKLFDIHMMCWGTGRERTSEEYADLFAASGWKYMQTLTAPGGMMSVVTGCSAG